MVEWLFLGQFANLGTMLIEAGDVIHLFTVPTSHVAINCKFTLVSFCPAWTYRVNYYLDGNKEIILMYLAPLHCFLHQPFYLFDLLCEFVRMHQF